MNTMSFKGYTARVEYDERDNLFVGRILGIHSIISFHGETVAELRAEFEHAIKDYLAECKKEGIHPEKPASGKLLLRVPPEIHGRALVAAQAAGKSLNQWATKCCSWLFSLGADAACLLQIPQPRLLLRTALGESSAPARLRFRPHLLPVIRSTSRVQS